jgi:uncharacterized membrane protein
MGEAALRAGAEPGLIKAWVELSATGIELLAVATIVFTIVIGTLVYIARILRGRADVTTYRGYRHQIARALLLGLELLVAADIIRTVALEPTLQNVMILGLLVVIRTVLSWGLVVEIEERWPWQPRGEAATGAVEGRAAV